MERKGGRQSRAHPSPPQQPAGRPLLPNFSGATPMLSPGRMEEFITEEEEPWYDQQDLEQGKARRGPPNHHSSPRYRRPAGPRNN